MNNQVKPILLDRDKIDVLRERHLQFLDENLRKQIANKFDSAPEVAPAAPEVAPNLEPTTAQMLSEEVAPLKQEVNLNEELDVLEVIKNIEAQLELLKNSLVKTKVSDISPVIPVTVPKPEEQVMVAPEQPVMPVPEASVQEEPVQEIAPTLENNQEIFPFSMGDGGVNIFDQQPTPNKVL